MVQGFFVLQGIGIGTCVHGRVHDRQPDVIHVWHYKYFLHKVMEASEGQEQEVMTIQT